MSTATSYQNIQGPMLLQINPYPYVSQTSMNLQRIDSGNTLKLNLIQTEEPYSDSHVPGILEVSSASEYGSNVLINVQSESSMHHLPQRIDD